jgi:hypothetical protein
VGTYEFIRVQYSPRLWRKEARETVPGCIQIGDLSMYAEYLKNMGKKGFQIGGFWGSANGEVVLLQRKLG